MSISLSSLRFPQLDASTRGRWAPVFLSPILGSPERFVIAVAAANGNDFHIERANELKRLSCLYGKAAETALFAADVAIDELEAALIDKGEAALVESTLVFSGVTLGQVSEGEARSLPHLSRAWMSALSSLYRFIPDPMETRDEDRQDAGVTADRLPALVLDHVNKTNPGLVGYFSDEIRHFRKRRPSSGIAEINIDFTGVRLVANFATLQSNTTALAVDRIKRKMFDLKVRQDRDGGLFEPRTHEMILFTPSRDSPLLNEKQAERIDEAVATLKEQSDNEGFGFTALHGVPEIGARVITAETQVQGTA